jgi:hypothetical protein
MLPVSLDCPFGIASSIFSKVYFDITMTNPNPNAGLASAGYKDEQTIKPFN